jgi:Arc/MetJ-type ribon-helix-helix transcriptional regulator
MKVEIKGRHKELVEAFVERNIYPDAEKVVEAAIELLLSKRLEEEAEMKDDYNTIDQELIDLQLDSVRGYQR